MSLHFRSEVLFVVFNALWASSGSKQVSSDHVCPDDQGEVLPCCCLPPSGVQLLLWVGVCLAGGRRVPEPSCLHSHATGFHKENTPRRLGFSPSGKGADAPGAVCLPGRGGTSRVAVPLKHRRSLPVPHSLSEGAALCFMGMAHSLIKGDMDKHLLILYNK